MPELTLSYFGPATSATPEWKQGDRQYWTHHPEVEHIAGAFRVVERNGDAVYIGNGESPEHFWMIWSWDISDE